MLRIFSRPKSFQGQVPTSRASSSFQQSRKVSIQGSASSGPVDRLSLSQRSTRIGNFHTVKEGENLGAILKEKAPGRLYGRGGQLEKLKECNPQLREPNLTFPGMVLKLPSEQPAQDAQAPSASAPSIPRTSPAPSPDTEGLQLPTPPASEALSNVEAPYHPLLEKGLAVQPEKSDPMLSAKVFNRARPELGRRTVRLPLHNQAQMIAFRNHYLRERANPDKPFDALATLGEGWKEVRSPSGTQAYELSNDKGARQMVVVSLDDIRVITQVPDMPAHLEVLREKGPSISTLLGSE